MAKLFTYLDRYFLKFSNLDSTTLSALKFFKEMVFDKLKDHFLEELECAECSGVKFFKEMVFDKLKEPLVGAVLEEI